MVESKHVDLIGFDEMQKLLSGAGLGAEQNAYNSGYHQKLGYNPSNYSNILHFLLDSVFSKQVEGSSMSLREIRQITNFGLIIPIATG
jgi:hypothetical protein